MTKLISSRLTFYYKWLFPILWFGFIAFFVVSSLRNNAGMDDLVFLLVPLLMAVIGAILFKTLLWNLADEVVDGGDYLLVRFRGAKDRIPLSNVMNVSASMLVNPPRLTLRLIQPSKFGTEVSFSPKRTFTLNPFAKSAVAEDLIVRAHHARSTGAP